MPYLAIIQDITKTSGDGLERTKGIRGFFDPVKNQLGPRIDDGLEVRIALIYRSRPDDWIRGSRGLASSPFENRPIFIRIRRAVCVIRKKVWLNGWSEKKTSGIPLDS